MGKERYGLIDAIRGFAVLNMVLYHFLYDVFVIYGIRPDWYKQYPVHLWQQFICWTFILLSGFVWKSDKKKNLKRGLFLNFWGLVITGATWAATPDQAVWFGILTFLGCAVWAMVPLSSLAHRINPKAGCVGSLLIFLALRNVDEGWVGFGSWKAAIPHWLYQIKFLTPFGFPYSGFYSSDYFPFLPWFFLFLTGVFAGKIFMQHETWKSYAGVSVKGLSYLGRKSIWIYLAHQPICMVVCMMIFS